MFCHTSKKRRSIDLWTSNFVLCYKHKYKICRIKERSSPLPNMLIKPPPSCSAKVRDTEMELLHSASLSISPSSSDWLTDSLYVLSADGECPLGQVSVDLLFVAGRFPVRQLHLARAVCIRHRVFSINILTTITTTTTKIRIIMVQSIVTWAKNNRKQKH